MADTVTVAGSVLSVANRRTYAAGSTIVLGAPGSLFGFPVPAKSVIHLDPAGAVVEAELKAAIKVGGIGLKKGATLAKERGEWIARGMLAAKIVHGGLALAGGDPVRVRPDGTIATAFPSKATKFAGQSYPESTEFRWTGSTWAAVSEDANWVPPAETDDDEDDDEADLDAETDDEDDEDDEDDA
jgi:hypothetical protein